MKNKMIKFKINKDYKLTHATKENHKVKVLNITEKSIKMYNYWLNNISNYRLHNNYHNNYQYIQHNNKGINVKSINTI
jgi:hypothetical protein